MSSPPKYREEFAARIRQAREDAHLTQEELARLLKVSGPTLSKCEGGRGDGAPSLLPMHLVGDFCLICRVRIGWLITGKGRMARRPGDDPQRAD